MAVKASVQITISKVIDIYACYRYYKLQSSTLVKPAKPTTNPPSGWSDTEPAYVSGSTNTLYFVDCNVYSDQSFSFSEVSISSSYEAAKDAWNKANKALNDTVVSVDVEYYLSTSATSLTGGSWSTTAPTWANGKYMWSRTVTVDGAGNKTYSPSQNGVCIAGAKGDTGAKGDKGDTGGTGAAGKGVTSIVEQYYKSTSATSLAGGSWSTTYPGWESGKYIWTRSVITYTDNTTSTTTAVCVTGTKGDTGATGAIGETLSNGKLLYKDVMFAEGNNGISSYNNSSGGAVTLVRQAKSSDNPCGDYELVITNTGAASPGIGGFKWAHATRANAVFIYRIIAKIPTDRSLRWMSNSAGGVTSGKFLTSNSGTGKFTEYIYKFTCGASGTFGTTGCFYINGSAGSSSSPVKWYVAYAGVWDMTDYEDMLPKDEAKDIYTTQLEMSKTNSELRLDFNKSISSASDDMQSKLDAANNATNQKFGEISKYIRFVDGKIVLGETGSELTLTVQNDRVSFQQAGNEVAYFSNNNLYIRRAEVLTTLKVGNYEFAPRNDGGLALRKRGN
nr:MAG TPA: tail protein [Caudoviricetes sp.]